MVKPDVLPAHLAVLSGPWAIWRWAGLRTAGFPVDLLQRVASDAVAGAADRYLADTSRAQIVSAGAEQARYQRAFRAALTDVSAVLNALAQDDRFREAILWQNRSAYHTGVKVFLRRSEVRSIDNAKHRKQQRLLVKYLQRYCAKNETIGFFGPVGWARLMDHSGALTVRPGPGLLATRDVYFEPWCVQAVADALTGDGALRPWIPPRRHPFVQTRGNVLALPGGRALRLSDDLAAALRSCDGQRSAQQVAVQVLTRPGTSLRNAEEVFRLLDGLHRQHLIRWTLDVPVDLRPEAYLREAVDAIHDERRRAAAIGVLTSLEAARERVAQAAGNPNRLDAALGQLDATFTRLTGRAATRSPGMPYAGRTIVYEDCRRDVAVDVGPSLLGELAAPLALILTSARWFTYRLAEVYRQAIRDLFRDYFVVAGQNAVPLATFWPKAYHLLSDGRHDLVDPLVADLHARWSRLLPYATGERRVTRRSKPLSAEVCATFRAPHPGWRAAAHHSPDVMIAAASAQAVQQGEYELVLGELHPSLNTLAFAPLVAHHPHPQELFDALASDLPGDRVVPWLTAQWPGITARTQRTLVTPHDYRLIFAPDSTGIPSSRRLPIGDLVVAASASTVVVRTRDGKVEFDIIEFLGEILSRVGATSWSLLPLAAHRPRITVDRLVVCRESWRFFPKELACLADGNAAMRFAAARRWMRSNDMPRAVFVRTPSEVKPFLVDFTSPISVDILASAVRTNAARSDAESFGVTEMLPSLEQAWLSDAEGRKYAAEFRFVVLDRALAAMG